MPPLPEVPWLPELPLPQPALPPLLVPAPDVPLPAAPLDMLLPLASLSLAPRIELHAVTPSDNIASMPARSRLWCVCFMIFSSVEISR